MQKEFPEFNTKLIYRKIKYYKGGDSRQGNNKVGEQDRKRVLEELNIKREFRRKF